MRLLILFFLAGLMHVSASTYSQTITFRATGLPLAEVIKTIRQQTGYAVYVNVSHLKESNPVSVNADNMPLADFLQTVLQNQPLEAKVEDKTIVLSRKAPTDATARRSRVQAGNNDYTEIRGVVVDSTGRAVTGASVSVLLADRTETSKVAVTDDRGNFTLRDVPQEGFLQITSIGFEPANLRLSTVTDPLALRIILKTAQTILDDVEVRAVNTGYQRIRPEQSTGAIAKISTKDYETRISTNFIDGLVNKLPGLMINNNVSFNSTAPDGSTSSRPLFNIRGISTMSANQNPLIVIDGYPTELTLNMIDPNEIKSVTILKDAASATVYGVRASNGVIVIEMKEARVGKPIFSFRANAGITPEEDYSRYRWAQNASEIAVDYHRSRNSASINSGSWDQLATNIAGTGGTTPRSPVYYILAQQAAKMINDEQAAQAFANLEQYDNLDDYSKLFTRPRISQNYNFNVSGGSANALYYVTANYVGDQQSQIENGNNSFMLSARSTMKFNPSLSLRLTTDYQENRSSSAPVPDITNLAPFERFQDVNGNPTFLLGSGISPWYNAVMMSHGLDDHLYYPLIDVAQIRDHDRSVNNRITADFRQLLGNGFDVTFGGVYETSRAENRYYAAEGSSVARRNVNSYVEQNADGTLRYHVPKGGYLQQDGYNTSGFTVRAQLNYNKIFDEIHSVNGIMGAEVRNLINTGNRATYFGYNDETLLHQPVDLAGINNGAIRGTYRLGSPYQNAFANLFNQQFTEDRFVSGYANLVYSYKNTYSLSGSIRMEQSNLFGTNPKYKYKPLWSAGAAWNIHREDFMQNADWISQLKLRMAYGFNGNVAKMSLPEVIARTVLNSYTSPATPSLRMVSYANSSLRWEQTNNFNVGLDYTLFRNVSGSIDYYQKKSIDLLGNAMIDPTIGASPSLINQATIRNNGVEFSLRADWIATPNFNWNTGLVAGHNASKVLKVYQNGTHNPEVRNRLGYVENYPVGAMFAYRYAGLDSAGFPLVVNTDGKLYHTNDNRLGSPTNEIMSSDTSGVIRYMGTSIPAYNVGFSNRVDIGNFYVYAMVHYYGGFMVNVPRPNPSLNRPLDGAGQYWRVPGDELTTDIMGLAAYSSYNSNSAYNYADKYVVRGDYITLGDLTMSYRLNNREGFIQRAGFSHFEIKAQASNIWTVGLNKYNYSKAAGSYQKSYVTPTYSIAIITNF